MKSYIIKKDAKHPLITLFFPKDSKWDGTAQDISNEIQELLEQAATRQFVVVDISESDPSVPNLLVAANYHMYSEWMLHKKLAGIFIVSTDPAVRVMLNAMKNQITNINIDFVPNRAAAIAKIK